MQEIDPLLQSPVAPTGPIVFDDETRQRVQEQNYDADYVEQYPDGELDLETNPIDRPHQITSTGLLKSSMWLDSARTLYGMFSNTTMEAFNKPDIEELSDEDVGEWGLELMGRFNWNLPEMAMMAYKIQGAPVEQRVAFYNMMETYDKLPNFTWDGSERMLKGLATDISSWVGLGTLGAGFLAKQAAKQAGKTGLKAALRATLPAGILTGIEGGVYTTVDDASRQFVKMASPTSGQTEYNVEQGAMSAGAGTVLGTGLGIAAPIVIPAVVRSAYKGFNDTVRAAQSGTFFSGVPTPGSSTRATGAQRGRRKQKAYRFKAGERDNLNAVAEQANLKSADVVDEYKRLKAQYPESDGWAPFNVTGAETKDGKLQLKIQEQAYDFHNKGNINTLSNKMVSEVLQLKQRFDNGDPVAAMIWEHRKWYSEMRHRLRREFGAFGDVFADVIGTTSAQTNVQQNWDNAIEVMHQFTRGEFDGALGQLDTWLKSGKQLGSGKVDGEGYVDQHYRVRAEAEAAAVKNGSSEDEAEQIAMQAAQSEFPLIGKRSGKLFNANSPATMMALLDLFRDIVPGSSPKTPNFTGNLIGFSDRATIDVWAARNLRRLAGQKRIPVVAEKGVGGQILQTTMQPGGEFGFGQDVYRETTNKLRQQGIDLNDDDLQAVVWFMEKEIWTENGWTTRAGEEALADPARKALFDDAVAGKNELGDFIKARTLAKQRDYIMQSEGIEDQAVALERVKEVKAQLAGYNREIRKYEALQPRLDKKVEKREGEVAEAEQVLERKVPARRLMGGLSLQEGDKMPSDPSMNDAQGRVLQTLQPDDSVLMMRATPSKGRYIDPSGEPWDERTIDFEYVARENHDPQDAVRQLVQEAKDANQESAFFSEVVDPGTVEGANPGMEVYFSRTLDESEVDRVTELINQSGLDVGFTFATDLRFAERQAGGADVGDYVGIRMQYIPEFGGGAEGALEATDKVQDLLRSLPDDVDFVSDVQYVEYDTEVFFRDAGDYDAELTGSVRQSRRAAWRR